MRYSLPQTRTYARGICILCAAYFVVFTFCFLYFLQPDLLAQAQFQFSEGTTEYHPFWAALLSTFLIFLLGVFLRYFQTNWLPLRMKACIWSIPFMLVAALTHWRFAQFGDTESAPSIWWWILLVLCYILLLLFGFAFPDSSKERESFATYAWPNIVLLIVFTIVCVSLSNTNITLHRTLRAARYMSEHKYEQVLDVARFEHRPPRQLSAMTAMALDETGQMGERLFAYSHPNGSEGLLPQLSDTALFFNLPRAVGEHLGYKCGPNTSVTFFLEVASKMPKAKPAMRNYLLAAYLLDRDLNRFSELLLQGDTLSTTLPRHYREALLLRQQLYPETQPEFEDSLLNADFQEFRTLLNKKGTKDEREFDCRSRFGATYWCYYFFR